VDSKLGLKMTGLVPAQGGCHRSGADREQIASFLGCKSLSELSEKTEGAKLEVAKAAPVAKSPARTSLARA
jgi:hypothetical protein